MTLDPAFTDRPSLRLRALHATTLRSAGRRRVERQLPRPAGCGRRRLCRQRPPVEDPSRRLRAAAHHRRVVPAVLEPLRRRPEVRSRRRALRQRAVTVRASPSPTTGRTASPVNPCGDPPGGAGGSMTSPTAEGGALRAQDVRTTGDPTGLNGAMLRVDPDTGDPLPDNPGTGTKNAPPDHRPRVPQPVPLRLPARHDRRLRRRRRLACVGGDQPRPGHDHEGPQLRLALLRGHRAPGRLRGDRPEPVQGLYSRRRRRNAPLYTYNHTRERRRRGLLASARRRSPASRSTTGARSRPPTTARCSSPTTPGAASG